MNLPDTTVTDQESKELLAKVNTLEVITTEQKVFADALLSMVYDKIESYKLDYEPLIDSAMDTKRKAEATRKMIVGSFHDKVDVLDSAKKIINNKIKDYIIEENRKARLEQLRIEAEELAKKEEEEKERKRLEDLKKKELEEERLKEAEALEAAGKTEEAEDLLEKEIVVAPVVSEPVVPVVSTPVAPKVSMQKGQYMKDNWKFRIVDFSKLPDRYKLPDEQKLRVIASSFKDQTNIPGVEVYNDPQLIQRRK